MYKEVASAADISSSSSWIESIVDKTEYRTPINEYSSRYIYTILLKNLNADSKYAFRITEDSWNETQIKTFIYKTFDTNNITIIDGGDMGNSQHTKKMNENTVSKIDSDLIMVGGDIAYDNNIASCYCAWDYILIKLPHHRLDPGNLFLQLY